MRKISLVFGVFVCCWCGSVVVAASSKPLTSPQPPRRVAATTATRKPLSPHRSHFFLRFAAAQEQQCRWPHHKTHICAATIPIITRMCGWPTVLCLWLFPISKTRTKTKTTVAKKNKYQNNKKHIPSVR